MTQPKINLTILKKHLKSRSQAELIADIAELYQRFQPVKDYYQVQLYPQDENQVAAKYKKIIEDEFFPARGFGKARLSVAKKAITEYKKVNKTVVGLIDIMLFYVEQGVRFTDAYGDIDEPFYISMETMYEKAVNEIIKHEQKDVFQKRCRKIVLDTSDMGWGFHDTLSEILVRKSISSLYRTQAPRIYPDRRYYSHGRAGWNSGTSSKKRSRYPTNNLSIFLSLNASS